MKSLFMFMVKNGGFIDEPLDQTSPFRIVHFVTSASGWSIPIDEKLFNEMNEANYLTLVTKGLWIPNCNHPDYPDTAFMWRQMYELIEEKLGMKAAVN